ncbi:hypothetical protein CN926_00765 [Bacillus thuringiensis]|uniref:HNH endonuclease n=1 Tax=Bacillus thuringiensis TaxID=1428 RepID=UPI000BFDAC04|nr:HNH endonuclease [Bacillus thuringiensis]PGL88569.1 hypothetical protein CN926_00765 [Bacillus thuringiensis]
MSKIVEVYSKGERFDIVIDDDIKTPSGLYRVFAKKNYFAFRENKKVIKLHRWIMGVSDKNVHVDHVNGDTLDNRRNNLRICTTKQNAQNKRVKGYYYDKDSGKYRTSVRIDGKLKNLGRYDTPEEAQQVYRKAHAEAFGEFSPYYEYYSGITKEEN